MKNFCEKVKIFIFAAVLALPGAIWYGVGILAPKTMEKWDFELKENRAEARLPDFEAGNDYTQKLESYYNDNIPFRSVLITWEQKLDGVLEGIYQDYIQGGLSDIIHGKGEDSSMDISGLLSGGKEAEEAFAPAAEEGMDEEDGHRYQKEVAAEATCQEEGLMRYSCSHCADSYTESIPIAPHGRRVNVVQEASYTSYGYTEYICDTCGMAYRDDFQGKIIDNSYLAPTVVGNGVLKGRHDWLFYTGDESIAYYEGSNVLEEERMEEYLSMMRRLQDICDEKGIRLQFIILPNREQMYPEYMPTCEIVDPYKRIDRLLDYIRNNSDINIIYPMQELREAELYRQTYFQYDTHWNNAGAFVGTQALYKALGMETTDLSDMEVEGKETEIRELITMGGLDGARYAPDENYVIHYKPEIAIESEEGDMFATWTYRAVSGSPNKKNFVLIGDSYRSFMTNYLVRDFSDCVIGHRHFVDEVEDDIRNADILVIEAVERYDDEMFECVEKVADILSEE